MELNETLFNALQEFAHEPQSKLPPLLEEFLFHIATTGQCLYPWSLVQPLVLCGLECALADLGAADLPPFIAPAAAVDGAAAASSRTSMGAVTPHHVNNPGTGHYLLSAGGLGAAGVAATGAAGGGAAAAEALVCGDASPRGLNCAGLSANTECDAPNRLLEIRDRVAMRVARFQAAPFTVQRLCELVASPREHYKRADKFLRGLERTVMVVSSVDPKGNRISDEVAYIEALDAAAAAAAAEANGSSPASSCAAVSTTGGSEPAGGSVGSSTPRSRRSSTNGGFGGVSPSLAHGGLASPPIERCANAAAGGQLPPPPVAAAQAAAAAAQAAAAAVVMSVSHLPNGGVAVGNMPPPTLAVSSPGSAAGQSSPGGGSMSPSRPAQALSPGAWRHGAGLPPAGGDSPSYDAAEFRTPAGGATPPMESSPSSSYQHAAAPCCPTAANGADAVDSTVRELPAGAAGSGADDAAVAGQVSSSETACCPQEDSVDEVSSSEPESAAGASVAMLQDEEEVEHGAMDTTEAGEGGVRAMAPTIAAAEAAAAAQHRVDNETGEVTEMD